MDFRFRERLFEELHSRYGVNSFDLISLAGGGRNLAQGGTARSVVMDNIAISFRLRNQRLIIIANHQDCGAYGGSQAFGCFEEERAFHDGEIDRAMDFLRRAFPGVQVEGMFLTLESCG
jgi:hypothetical protein